jgi:hypothetical protein
VIFVSSISPNFLASDMFLLHTAAKSMSISCGKSSGCSINQSGSS